MSDVSPFIFDDDDSFFWQSLFEALSSDHFDSFSWHLGFPFNITDDIRLYAKDCAIIGSNCIGIKTPENSSIPITDLPKENVDIFIAQLYQKTFLKFESLNHGIPLYEWGKAQIHKKNQYDRTIGFPSSLDGLLLKWADNDFTDMLIYFIPLNLPYNLIQELKMIILKHQLRISSLSVKINRLEISMEHHIGSYKAWEVHLFCVRRVGTWVNNQVRLNLQIQQWQEVFNLLSNEQLIILEEWCYKNMELNRIAKPDFSISEIAKNFL